MELRNSVAILSHRGGGNVEQMYSRLPAPPDQARGYSVAEMRRFGSQVGVSLSLEAPRGLVIAGECSPRPPVTAHFRRLAQLVAAGSPVVVPVSVRFGAGHYLILVGAQGDSFTAHDPASPGLKQLSTSELAARMCDYGYVALRALTARADRAADTRRREAHATVDSSASHQYLGNTNARIG